MPEDLTKIACFSRNAKACPPALAETGGRSLEGLGNRSGNSHSEDSGQALPLYHCGLLVLLFHIGFLSHSLGARRPVADSLGHSAPAARGRIAFASRCRQPDGAPNPAAAALIPDRAR